MHSAMLERRIPGQIDIEKITLPEEPVVVLIRSIEEIEALENPEEVELIHLISWRVANTLAVEKLVEACPNLTTVQICPSLSDALSRKARSILEEKGLELQVVKGNIQLPPGTQIIRSIDEVDQLEKPDEILAAHLSHQEAVAAGTITRLLEACPNLTTISIVPSLAESKVSPTAQRILAESGIEIQVKRLRDSPLFDSIASRDCAAKKRVYEEMLNSPDKKEERRLFFLLEDYGFGAAEMVKMYLGEETMNISKVARKMGLKYFEVQRNVAALLHLIGYPSSEKGALSRSRKWLRELKKRAEAEAWRGYYQVGEIQPPKTLPRRQWEMWQKIMQSRVNNPNRWFQLKENYPVDYQILVNFYQIDEARGKGVTLEEMARQLSVSYQRIGQRKDWALGFLGLLEED